MQQTEQNRAKAVEPARQQKEQQAHPLPDYAPAMALTLALQAVQAGIPLTQMPASMVLALSAEIGNSALLDLMAQQGNSLELITAVPPPLTARTEPFTVTAAPLAALSPPDWAGMPPVQAAPASPSGLAMGGALFAGG